MWKYDIEFVQNLRKTVAWTEFLMSLEETVEVYRIFRKTIPKIGGVPLFDLFHWEVDWHFPVDKLETFQVALKEAMAVRKDPGSTLPEINGRILCFDIGLSTNDGAAWPESDGFMDEWDIPPIDTWFALNDDRARYKAGTLFCYIPEAFIKYVENAISVEIFGSYQWLDVLYPEMDAAVRQMYLMSV